MHKTLMMNRHTGVTGVFERAGGSARGERAVALSTSEQKNVVLCSDTEQVLNILFLFYVIYFVLHWFGGVSQNR